MNVFKQEFRALPSCSHGTTLKGSPQVLGQVSDSDFPLENPRFERVKAVVKQLMNKALRTPDSSLFHFCKTRNGQGIWILRTTDLDKQNPFRIFRRKSDAGYNFKLFGPDFNRFNQLQTLSEVEKILNIPSMDIQPMDIKPKNKENPISAAAHLDVTMLKPEEKAVVEKAAQVLMSFSLSPWDNTQKNPQDFEKPFYHENLASAVNRTYTSCKLEPIDPVEAKRRKVARES